MKSLREIIAVQIRRDGPIPFSRYMELCLYAPALGYYQQPRQRFGRAGDFYTSSDVHAVFGRLLCTQFEEMWRALASPEQLDLIELGPGRALFAADVLDWAAKRYPDFARAFRYCLVESSEYLRARATERLGEHVAAGRATLHETLDSAGAECGANVIVYANEFFDALPLEIVTAEGMVVVGVDGDRFIEQYVPAPPEIAEYLDHYSCRPEPGERREVCLAALQWMDRIAPLFTAGGRRGFCLFVDYGYTRPEQLAGRHQDTLMTYQRHRAGCDPYAAPGDEDITAHVNFTALAAAAERSGLAVQPLLTQAQLLLGIGEPSQFADVLEASAVPQERAKMLMQLKHLITPEGMGETFRALLLSHGVDLEAVRKLSGLSFLRR